MSVLTGSFIAERPRVDTRVDTSDLGHGATLSRTHTRFSRDQQRNLCRRVTPNYTQILRPEYKIELNGLPFHIESLDSGQAVFTTKRKFKQQITNQGDLEIEDIANKQIRITLKAKQSLKTNKANIHFLGVAQDGGPLFDISSDDAAQVKIENKNEPSKELDQGQDFKVQAGSTLIFADKYYLRVNNIDKGKETMKVMVYCPHDTMVARNDLATNGFTEKRIHSKKDYYVNEIKFKKGDHFYLGNSCIQFEDIGKQQSTLKVRSPQVRTPGDRTFITDNTMVIARKPGESIAIGDDILVTVVKHDKISGIVKIKTKDKEFEVDLLAGQRYTISESPAISICPIVKRDGSQLSVGVTAPRGIKIERRNKVLAAKPDSEIDLPNAQRREMMEGTILSLNDDHYVKALGFDDEELKLKLYTLNDCKVASSQETDAPNRFIENTTTKNGTYTVREITVRKGDHFYLGDSCFKYQGEEYSNAIVLVDEPNGNVRIRKENPFKLNRTAVERKQGESIQIGDFRVTIKEHDTVTSKIAITKDNETNEVDLLAGHLYQMSSDPRIELMQVMKKGSSKIFLGINADDSVNIVRFEAKKKTK